MFNKALAGKKVLVPTEVHESSFIEFDEVGNLKTKLTKESESILLNMSGYESGAIEIPKVVEKSNPLVDELQQKISSLEAELQAKVELISSLEAELKLKEASPKPKK